jgi:hypothetical protein
VGDEVEMEGSEEEQMEEEQGQQEQHGSSESSVLGNPLI